MRDDRPTDWSFDLFDKDMSKKEKEIIMRKAIQLASATCLAAALCACSPPGAEPNGTYKSDPRIKLGSVCVWYCWIKKESYLDRLERFYGLSGFFSLPNHYEIRFALKELRYYVVVKRDSLGLPPVNREDWAGHMKAYTKKGLFGERHYPPLTNDPEIAELTFLQQEARRLERLSENT